MAQILCDDRTDADPVAAAAALLATTGVSVLPSIDVTHSLGAGGEVWTRFARHWDQLAPDPYAAELGVTRLRRYGQYLLDEGVMHPMPTRTFAQPQDSNPLYIGRNRDFEPLTDSFTNDPVLPAVVRLLARVAAALDDVADWNVKVHLFRIRSSADDDGRPAPEGPHRDGVTPVSSLLVARRNAMGGESSVCDGRPAVAEDDVGRARDVAARRRPSHPAQRVGDPADRQLVAGAARRPGDHLRVPLALSAQRIVAAVNPVFVDVDTGVDDALALVYLLASPDANVVGIASTGGNVAIQQVCENNLCLLELCRATGVPVSKGSDETLTGPMRGPSRVHGPRGLGYASLPPAARELTDHDSATAWVRAAHAFPGELVGVATGPLTNLALALRAEPALPTLLHRLVIMGGSYDHRGNTTAVAEWNISVDPEAAAEVLAAWGAEAVEPQRLPILCGLDLTRNVAMTPDHLARLAAAADSTTTVMSARDERGTPSTASNPLIRVIEDAMRFYLEAYHDNGHGYQAHLHDPLAAAVALDPELITTRPARVDVELTGTLTRGMTVTDWTGRREPNALIGIDVDSAAFFDRFIGRVGPFARRLGDRP